MLCCLLSVGVCAGVRCLQPSLLRFVDDTAAAKRAASPRVEQVQQEAAEERVRASKASGRCPARNAPMKGTKKQRLARALGSLHPGWPRLGRLYLQLYHALAPAGGQAAVGG